MIRFKRLVQIILILLIFSPASSANQVIIDRLTASEEEKLDIQIPEDTKPGFHELIIEIYDENGTIKETLIDFCKTQEGEIRWDNNCPNLEATTDYFPSQDADAVVDSMILLFALAAAAAMGSKQRDRENQRDGEGESEEEREQGDIASSDSGKLKVKEREEKWGDQSPTWKAPLTSRVDAIGQSLAPILFKLSPVIARSFIDSSYLRAIFGSASLFIYPIAVWVGLEAATGVSLHPVVPSTIMLVALICLGILDSFAGLLGGIAFLAGTFLEGNIANQDQLLTVLGVLAIAFTPSLIASAFRPLRRLVDAPGEKWERVKDYALVTVLTGWAISKIVAALNGLSGEKLEISTHAQTIGLITGGAIVLRLIGEELATYAYPKRLIIATPVLPDPNLRQRIMSLLLKTFIFFVVAAPFVGVNNQLYIGLAIFALPALISLLLKGRVPSTTVLGRLLPNGALKIVVMIIVGSLFGSFVKGLYSDPQEFIKWSFVLLAIPGAVIAFLSIFAKSPIDDWKASQRGARVDFVGGIVVYLLILAAVSGQDLVELLIGTYLPLGILLVIGITALIPKAKKANQEG